MKKLLKYFIYLILLAGITIGALELFSTYKPSTSIHTEAPVITHRTILINAPVEKVWSVFGDIDRWPAWQKEIPSIKLNGPLQTGTTFDWKNKGLTIHSTLHTVDSLHKIGWSGTAFGSFAIHNWTFTAKGNTTEVAVDESMEGWLVWLLKGTFQTALDNSLTSWLAALKTAAEK